MFSLRMHRIHNGLAGLKRLDTNLLVALEVLLRQRSVTQAAADLGVTQSAMSHTLRRLRETLGDPLLVRTSSGMLPTPRAEAIELPVRTALLALAKAIDDPDAFEPHRSERTFRISAPDLFDTLVSPTLMGRLTNTAPRVGLTWIATSSKMQTQLETGEIDFAVVATALNNTGKVLGGGTLAGDLRQRTLLEDSWRVFVRVEHPSDARRRISPKAFSEFTHALVSPTGTGDGIVEPILAQHGLRRRIGLRTPNIASAIAAVRVTDMVLVAPGSLLGHAKELGLRELKTSLEFPRHRLQLLWHPRVDADLGHRWFRELIVDAVGPLRTNSTQPAKRTPDNKNR